MLWNQTNLPEKFQNGKLTQTTTKALGMLPGPTRPTQEHPHCAGDRDSLMRGSNSEQLSQPSKGTRVLLAGPHAPPPGSDLQDQECRQDHHHRPLSLGAAF